MGFRPFILRVATRLGLVGFVKNTSGGVEIEAQGPPSAVDAFLLAIRQDLPAAARIDHLHASSVDERSEGEFLIISSGAGQGEAALISPDLAPCEDCLRELAEPLDRRFGYPFINCTSCGPRFTIVQEVPYDRPMTTMAGFVLCPECLAEYREPLDRRYHAQPIACPVCGPTVTLESSQFETLRGSAAILRARELLQAGALLGVKGVGGVVLCCDATREDSVRRLRERKRRPSRPLALMARDIERLSGLCELSEREAAELCSPRRPILLLRRRELSQGAVSAVAPSVAPGHVFLGVMLPSAPLFSMLLQAGEPESPSLIVATSGNRSGGPIARTNEDARRDLGGIVDALLLHDREIWNRCDDSVGYFSRGAEGEEQLVLLRRSRGYAPLPVELPVEVAPTLAVGAMLASTVALASGRRAFPSQHVGDTDDQETLEFLEETLHKLRRWLKIEPELVARDLHPDLPSSHLATRLAEGKRLVLVQHHHAHLASALVAHGLGPDEDVLALVLDGTGYGSDGAIWGCELLLGSARRAWRVGSLEEMPLPGGDSSIKRPERIAAAWLHAIAEDAAWEDLPVSHRLPRAELETLRRMVDRRFNTPRTTSAGRLFDVVSSLLGVVERVSYEGQAAIELEQMAWRAARADHLEMGVQWREGRVEFSASSLLRDLLARLRTGGDRASLALDFHVAFAGALVRAVSMLVEKGAPRRVVLCGGVFQNRILTDLTMRGLQKTGMSVHPPGALPVGDGGLALGQVYVANAAGPGLSGELLLDSPCPLLARPLGPPTETAR